MTGLVIKGGRVVDPASSLNALRDIRVRDGKIAEIGEHLHETDDDAIIDAAGTIVAPGFVDMHVHLREPGFAYKERLETGTEAALRGGFTSLACMPNTNPALDEPDIIADLLAEIDRRARCRVYPIAAITRGRRGKEPCDFVALGHAGAVAFSDDGDTVEDSAVLFDAAARAAELFAPFISHCEDPILKRAHAGGRIAEAVSVARDVLIAGETRKAWHIAHVSTRAALEAIACARFRGTSVTCEVTPHHLALTAASSEELGPQGTVNPPLASQDDVSALREAVRDGTIDAFASDHAPHTAAEKSGQPGPAAPGFSGLEIAAGAYAAAIPDLPIERFVALISSNPARILRLPAGTLRLGAAADITIFADRPWTVDPATFASLGKCTPFAGRTLPRKVLATLVAGDVRYRAPELRA